jgi:hypothetical protein
MEWKDIDWVLLRTLRKRFLSLESGDYWQSLNELEHYDLTFAARIASKWRAVCREMEEVPWKSPITLFDWGSGTGIASRVFCETFPGQIAKVIVWDQSPLAREFAAGKLRDWGVPVEVLSSDTPVSEPYWFLGSHVWNELSAPSQHRFLERMDRSQGFFWVEPGTPELSHALIEVRAMARNRFRILAPCSHQETCGMLAPQNASHWCHHFAPPEPECFTTAHWKKFSDEMKIDLRALPLRYLVGAREVLWDPSETAGRVIGRPRTYKGFVKALVCDADGVEDRVIYKGKKTKEFSQVRFARWVRE